MDQMPEHRQRTQGLTLPLRPQDDVECRRCGVHCDKVVYPSACLERSCPFVYAYEEHGHTFMGCMQKVFEAEIDLDMLLAAGRRREGFGAVRALRAPLPMCRSDVEPCFARRLPGLGCTNPEFNELPTESQTFRVFARVGDA
ncbi:MAG TPA: hypothetical protein VNH40_09015 [Gaiellaceae bacterium]|nr:hypothetical protein [Gaiellaceae bacterium]